MAFAFGTTNQSQPALNFGTGTNQAKPTFGTGTTGFAFGTQTSTAQPTFGFGATTTTSATQPNFGFGSSFGTSTATTASSGFGTLGTTASKPTPIFGGFGTATTSTPAAFGFGSTATTATPTGFGGFSNFGSSTTGNTGLGTFGGFGTTATTTSTQSLFGLGTTTTTTGSAFGNLGSSFGAKPTGTPFGGFGSTFGSTFGGGGTLGTGTSFGTSGFGTGTGGIGSTFGTGSLFGQPQQQPQQILPPDPNQLIANAVLNVKIFGDERDQILAKWNLLQASWGVGKGYYSQTAPPVDFTPDNPYCRFKAIVYSAMPGRDNKDGIVILVFNKLITEVKTQQQQVQVTIQNILGNKPELAIIIEDIKDATDNKTQLSFYVEERNQGKTIRRIPATDISTFLNQPLQKQQLANISASKIFPNLKPDADQLKEYLNTPPAGVDPRIWNQAQLDNPDPNKFIPVPVIGYEQLKWRVQIQETETALHRAYLDKVTEAITELKQKHAASIAHLAEQKQKFLDLQHRVLKILVKQETTRKIGMALQPEEEQLRIQLENMLSQVSMPTQFRSRLAEMIAHIRIQKKTGESYTMDTNSAERYQMDPAVQDDIKQFLSLQQAGINHLIQTVNDDLTNLMTIKETMLKLLQT